MGRRDRDDSPFDEGFFGLFEELAGGILPFALGGRAIQGGCLGFIMSWVALFAFFAGGIIYLTGEVQGFRIDPAAGPILLGLLVLALLSPIGGIFMGLRREYNMGAHCGCFMIFFVLIVGAVLFLSLT